MEYYIINGPNLNFLGIREPQIYGTQTLQTLEKQLNLWAKMRNVNITYFQSNSEGEIIDCLQGCYNDKVDGIVINAGAYTHYSYAIRDAIESINIPTIEVHLSNIHNREEFRQNSVIAPVCIGSICGLGIQGYELALSFLLRQPEQKD
ncbi:MAG: type II 3-dehydroquinate dehydratase [Epulopiscium sp. Nele67-Bin005]|nr:MAG: type II 3-dehydroquinate dehydratase [Epulopiscium sp. Nele67-Bin005]